MVNTDISMNMIAHLTTEPVFQDKSEKKDYAMAIFHVTSDKETQRNGEVYTTKYALKIMAYGQIAELVKKHLKKGSYVYLEVTPKLVQHDIYIDVSITTGTLKKFILLKNKLNTPTTDTSERKNLPSQAANSPEASFEGNPQCGSVHHSEIL